MILPPKRSRPFTVFEMLLVVLESPMSVACHRALDGRAAVVVSVYCPQVEPWDWMSCTGGRATAGVSHEATWCVNSPE